MRVKLFLFITVIFAFTSLFVSATSLQQLNKSSLIPFTFQVIAVLMVIFSNNWLISRKASSALIFGYSLLMLFCFKTNFYLLHGTLFEPSAIDSLQYWKITKEYSHYSIIDAIKMFISHEDIEDLGAFFYYSIAYRLYPSIVSYNILLIFLHLLTVSISFKVLRFFGVKRSFHSIILFGLNGASIYLISTGMKEIAFGFHTSLVFYFLMLTVEKKTIYIVPLVLCLLAIYFFRPMVMMFIIFSILMGFWSYLSGRTRVLSLICIIIVVLNLSLPNWMFGQLLYLSPEVVAQKQNLRPNLFNYSLSILSILGPYPSFQLFKGSEQQLWYGIGLMVKLAFVYPFFNGYINAWKSKQVVLVSMATFVLLNGLGLAMILESFEYRLQYPHISSYFIVAIYGLSNGLDKSKVRLTNTVMFSVMFLWNLRFYI